MNAAKMLLSAALALPMLAGAAPLDLDFKIDRPYLPKDKRENVVIRIGLKADQLKGDRAPLNLALVLDRSGSMSGGKISRLREAARYAVERLRRDDILSIVAFDTDVKVLYPARKVGDGRAAMRAIDGIEADGSTALYGGVDEGLRQLSEYKGQGRVSRLILLSDGLANVGPSSPQELAGLGREAGRRGIPVTTFGLGLGYGEDLMAKLASASDGNHAFIADEGSLASYFNKELGEALSIAARDIVIEIKLAKGVNYRQSFDREVQVTGDTVRWKLNQLGGGTEKRLLLEVEAPALKDGEESPIASAEVVYLDGKGAKQAALESQVTAQGAAQETVESHVTAAVAAEAVLARANQKREEAIQLKDQGKAAEAAQVLSSNATALRAAEDKLGKGYGLGASASDYEGEATAAQAPSAEAWNSSRKMMKARSHKEATQQSY